MSQKMRQMCPMCGKDLAAEMGVCSFCGESFIETVGTDDFQINPSLVKKYHQQTRVLGGMWIFIGGVPCLFGIYWLFQLLASGPYDGGFIFWLILFGLYFCGPGAVMVFLGLMVRKKKRICLTLSLILGYLILLFCVATGFTLPILPGLLTVVMSHTCFHTSNQMRKAGIPLETPIPES